MQNSRKSILATRKPPEPANRSGHWLWTPCTTLGVKKDATPAEIQKACRRLAKKLHPDLNPGKQSLALPDGTTLDVNIPPGIQDGKVLRLKGKGRPAMGDGPPGDALIEIGILELIGRSYLAEASDRAGDIG
jgi:DnaJ-class molecular chaperone